MTVIKATVRDRRIEVPAPSEFPDGTEVVLAIDACKDEEPMSAEEIACVLAAMQQLQPLEISTAESDELEAFEKKLHQHGIDNTDRGIEGVFP
jgi:hypothetical protein